MFVVSSADDETAERHNNGKKPRTEKGGAVSCKVLKDDSLKNVFSNPNNHGHPQRSSLKSKSVCE